MGKNGLKEQGVTSRDALGNLVPFVQFKKREKYPWRSDTCSKVAVCCTNSPKSRKASYLFEKKSNTVTMYNSLIYSYAHSVV